MVSVEGGSCLSLKLFVGEISIGNPVLCVLSGIASMVFWDRKKINLGLVTDGRGWARIDRDWSVGKMEWWNEILGGDRVMEWNELRFISAGLYTRRHKSCRAGRPGNSQARTPALQGA